mmetsp:Transcript_51097/g.102082  ORF Transcript_51097/g.102082 Transcript_51097/m.102082 type:complete len:218 (-) Transcript_51097:23-676(-)
MTDRTFSGAGPFFLMQSSREPASHSSSRMYSRSSSFSYSTSKIRTMCGDGFAWSLGISHCNSASSCFRRSALYTVSIILTASVVGRRPTECPTPAMTCAFRTVALDPRPRTSPIRRSESVMPDRGAGPSGDIWTPLSLILKPLYCRDPPAVKDMLASSCISSSSCCKCDGTDSSDRPLTLRMRSMLMISRLLSQTTHQNSSSLTSWKPSREPFLRIL